MLRKSLFWENIIEEKFMILLEELIPPKYGESWDPPNLGHDLLTKLTLHN